MTKGMIQGHRRISGPTETPDGFPLPSEKTGTSIDCSMDLRRMVISSCRAAHLSRIWRRPNSRQRIPQDAHGRAPAGGT
jgi:hypothetical protein